MKKKRFWRRLCLRGLLLVFFTAAFFLGSTYYEYHRSAQIYAESRRALTVTQQQPAAETIATATEPEYWLPPLIEVDFASLQAVNPQVCAWLLLPDSPISYPLTQAEDNEYYLDHTYDRQSNNSGCLFVDSRNSVDFSDFNTVVYGHNMRNGSMFGELQDYRDLEYWFSHPYVYLVTPQGMLQYRVFAAYDESNEADAYVVDFADDITKRTFIDRVCKLSLVQGVDPPTQDDRILTLSTCTSVYSWQRFIVHARLVEVGES